MFWNKNQILKKLKSIKDGWTNMIDRPRFFEPEAEKRASECAKCPYNKANICTKCACVINAKIWSFDEECPKGKWKAVSEEEILELIDRDIELNGE